MNTFKRIIFVSNEDRTRGPMAAAIMINLLKDKEESFLIESRGMVVLFPEPYSPKAVEAAKLRDMNLPSTFSRQLSSEDFAIDTLVLTMEAEQKDKIYRKYPAEARNVFTLSEFAGEPQMVLPNPYGGSDEDYRQCFDVLYGIVFKATDALLGYKDTIREKINTGGN